MKVPDISMGLSGLPTPVKVVAGVIGAGAMLGLSYFVFGGNKAALVIVALGIVLVVLLLVVYKLILNWSRKRKANPLSQGLSGNAAAAPQGISEPARRARLDDLRRNFEQGVEKFRAAGKNLYSVPWYALVGEPGSGKTEAIRHCNVGFPPGLQDQLQGAGGTLNMNWWFTNQAIILDTAGRLMFEEVPAGSTNEWQEFLKLLKQNRPNCPINGMLLVIPVDTLIKDSADSIEKKAGKIAQQLDQIQRTLGVRFPVFVIISKCDLLNGFREFFDDLNDPQLQHQIMGWSNPAPLDEKFNPMVVMNHLETVKQRLTERRQQLILDPVNSEDAQSRRVDQVDALYALPDSIIKIGPRLRRYLEMIFQPGEWSPQPLFLRGIYFTSSMTEGSALDAELAEVLGVPVDSLPEGRVWRRDRAYFLRDLFIEKVFREKGLVTRASNADKQQRTRRAIILTVGFLAVAVLFAFTWFGARQLESSIGKHRDFWTAAAEDENLASHGIINKDGTYNIKPIQVGKTKSTLAEFFGQNFDLIKSKIAIPVVFKPMSFISGDIDAQRHTAYRSLYEATILSPIYSSARSKMTATTWSDAATDSLIQLMKLEYAAATGKVPEGDPHPEVNIDPLFRLSLTPDDYQKFQKADETDLQNAADWIYSSEADPRHEAWPARALQPESPDSLTAVDEGLSRTLEYWKDQSTSGLGKMGHILAVYQALKDFRDAENKLLTLRRTEVEKLDPYWSFVDSWEAGRAALDDAAKRASAEWALATKGDSDSASLKDVYSKELDNIAAQAQQTYDKLLKLTVDSPADAAKASDAARHLADARVKVQAAQTALADWKNGDVAKRTLDDITTLDGAYISMIKGTDGNSHHRFEVQDKLYADADAFLVKRDNQNAYTLTGPLGAALSSLDDKITAANDSAAKVLIQANGPDDRLSQAGELSKFTIDLGARTQRYFLATTGLQSLPKSTDGWQGYIATLAATVTKENLNRPEVPLIEADKKFPAKFAPSAVGSVNEVITSIDKLTSASVAKILNIREVTDTAAGVRKSFGDYLADYRNYWELQVFNELNFGAKNWTELSGQLQNLRETAVRVALEDYGKKVSDALKKIGDPDNAVSSVDDALSLGNNRSLQEEIVKNMIPSWGNLSQDPHEARRFILAMDQIAFLQSYTSGTAIERFQKPMESTGKAVPPFVAAYWRGLPIKAVSVLGNDGQAEINAGLAELAKYERFPFAPPGPTNKDDLSAQDLVNARAALEKVRGSELSAITIGTKSLAQGAHTTDSDMNEALENLRGVRLLKDKQPYFNALARLCAALPTDTHPISAMLTVAKDKLKADGSVAYRFSYVDIAQAGQKPLAAALGSLTEVDATPIEYAGGDVSFQFRETTKPDITTAVTFPGPWAIFRLLKDPHVKSYTRDGNKWLIEYSVIDPKNEAYSLWLQLEFKAEVPDLKDWPVPPAKSAP